MSTVSGVVRNLSSKRITSKAGRSFTLHLVELEDGTVVNVGFKQPFSIGDNVKLNVESKFGELKMVTGEPSAGDNSATGASPSGVKKPPFEGGGRNTKFPVPETHGDYSIIRQNALTNAVSYFNANKGAITFEAGIDEVIKVAYKFAEFTSGHREKRIVKELAPRNGVPGSSDD